TLPSPRCQSSPPGHRQVRPVPSPPHLQSGSLGAVSPDCMDGFNRESRTMPLPAITGMAERNSSLHAGRPSGLREPPWRPEFVEARPPNQVLGPGLGLGHDLLLVHGGA